MTTRTVTTDLKNLVDTGWAFGTVYITLRDTQLNGDIIYPVQTYKIQTDANGVSSDELAVPDTGVFIYSFELPDGLSCDFELGVGDPITLGSLISTWCGQTILQPSADTTYLRIDTTNSPLTGELLLAGNPTNVLGATPKQYVDSTNVTLAGTPDYLTIEGQVITRNQIDLTTDVTGVLLDANIPDNIIRVSANDTTPEYLADKAVSGTGITSTILNPIGDESLEFKMDDHYLALASAGLYTGGILSAGTTGTFSYTSGESLAIDSSNYPASGIAGVSFVAQTNVPLTNILTQPVTYIMVDSSGLPVQLSAFPTPTQRRDNTFLGVVVHTDNVNVNNVNNTPSVAGDTVGQLQDLMLGLGVFNLEGNRISPNGVNLSIAKSAGKVFKAGINFNSNPKDPHTATLIAQPLVTFRYRNQDSSEGIDTTLLDPTTWDNAGVTSTVPQPNDATIQRVYMFPTGVIRIQRGQEYFTSLAEAIDTIGKEQFLTEPNIAENGLLLASIAIAKRTTDVSDTDDCVIFIASRFGELGSVGSSAITSLQQAYDNSIVPQITTNATLGALTVKRGSALDTDNIIVGTNGAGTTTFSVTGEGDIAGANLSGTNTGDQDLSGYLAIDGSNANTTINIQGQALRLGGSADEIQSIIKGNSAQTTNLTEWQDSGGTALAKITSLGYIGSNITPPAPISGERNGTGLQTLAYFRNTQAAATDVGVNIQLAGSGGFILGSLFSGWEGAATTDSYFGILTRGNNIPSEKLRVTSSGNVGISTINPLAKLHIKGTADELQQIVQANSIQNVNLTEWQNSSGVEQTYIKANYGLVTGGDRVKSTETSTTTATVSDSVEVHFANATVDYTLTLPTGVTGKEISIININTATVTLSGSINLISATDILYSGETIRLIYNGTEWC